MKKINNQKGITLVALVITIIILLILAGISIASLTQTGLFAKAQEAKNKTENAQREENETLENYLAQINEITVGTSGGGQESAESSTSTTHTAIALTYTWDEIANIAKVISNTNSINENTLEVNVTLNNKTYTLGVGDTATVDGKTVRILGFNHDNLTNPTTAYGTTTATGKAGISFEYVDFIDVSGTGAGTTYTYMNSSDTNSGGWEACALRNTLNGTVYDSLTIKDKIKQVKKDYIPTYNSATTTTCDDYLWLLSCAEIWDNGCESTGKGLAMGIEGSQYKYYKSTLGSTTYDSSTDITNKPNVSNSDCWWLRSPYGFDIFSFCYVLSSGFCDFDSAGQCGNGVAPGFSI